MKEIKYPSSVKFWTVKKDGNVIHKGMTKPNQVTSSNRIIDNSDNADDVFPQLPEEIGTPLEKGEVYSFEGGMVRIEQSHERTIYPPMQTPALITFTRKEVGDLQWIENEQVAEGMRRWFDNVEYIVNVGQGHLTQLLWIPTLATTLWSLYEETSTEIPQWDPENWATYIVGFQVESGGKIWEAKNVSHTYIKPALTGDGSISWEFIKNI